MPDGKYHCRMAASCTNTYKLPSPGCSTKAKRKSLSPNKKYWSSQERKKSGEWTISIKMTRQKEQQDSVQKLERRQEKGIKWQPWDSRQEEDIIHPWPPFGEQFNIKHSKKHCRPALLKKEKENNPKKIYTQMYNTDHWNMQEEMNSSATTIM